MTGFRLKYILIAIASATVVSIIVWFALCYMGTVSFLYSFVVGVLTGYVTIMMMSGELDIQQLNLPLIKILICASSKDKKKDRKNQLEGR